MNEANDSDAGDVTSVATLRDEEIETRTVARSGASIEADDGDDSTDSGDASDTGDDSEDTGDDSSDVADTGDDPGDDSATPAV